MKKLFAVILAILVVPTFNTYAWVGGPFNNNSFTPEGDDGIYEAVAVPVIGSGMGLYRWGVSNRNLGGLTFTNQLIGNTGNVQFGGMVGAFNQHTWYLNGEVYYGPCFGSVNSSVGTVRCVGNAATSIPSIITNGDQGNPFITTTAPTDRFIFDAQGNIVLDGDGNPIPAALGDLANSFFQGKIDRGNYNHAARRFSGRGEMTANVLGNGAFAAGAVTTVKFRVFGSRVSLVVTG